MTRVIDRSETQTEPSRALVKPEQNGALVPIAAPSMESIIAAAVDKGTPPESLEKLLAVFERMTAIKSKQAFDEAMSAFKADCPAVPRRTENGQFKVTRNGVAVNRRYAALEDIESTIRGPLGRHGLSFRWGATKVDAGILSMACIVSHAGGHSESSSVQLPIDSKAGCSDQQKMGAAMTYAQRYSLIQALGLTSCDDDADGAEPEKPVTAEQAANLQHLIDETNSDKGRFLAAFDAESLDTFPSSKFSEAIAAFEKKRRKS